MAMNNAEMMRGRGAVAGSVAGTVVLAMSLACGSASGGIELLNDPGFDQFDTFWGSFGAAGFHDFFGGNPHASLFADGVGNFGGVFQTGLADSAAQYEFALTNVRIESNFNANLRFGLEFYAADDATKLGETIVSIDTNDPNDGLVTGDGLGFSMTADSVAGAAFVRPIVLFDGADPLGSGQANAFVFSASLTAVPAPAGLGALACGMGLAARRRR